MTRDLVTPLLGPVQTAAERTAREEADCQLHARIPRHERPCPCGLTRGQCEAQSVADEGTAHHDDRVQTCPCGEEQPLEAKTCSTCSTYLGADALRGECSECDEPVQYAPSADLSTLTCPHCHGLAAIMCGMCSSLGVRPVGSDDVHPRCGEAEREMRRRDEDEWDYGVDHYADEDEDGTWSAMEVVA